MGLLYTTGGFHLLDTDLCFNLNVSGALPGSPTVRLHLIGFCHWQ